MPPGRLRRGHLARSAWQSPPSTTPGTRVRLPCEGVGGWASRYRLAVPRNRGREGGVIVESADGLLNGRLLSASEVCGSPSAVPAVAGVYGWWFDEVPGGVPVDGCVRRDRWTLLYVGISPKRPPVNGRPPSRQTARDRIRYHFRGNAEGSTLRLTLGVLLGLELRRVGSGTRRTFASQEVALSEWMACHARVSVAIHEEPWVLESRLIGELVLPLNLDQSGHPFRSVLSAMRSAAKARAVELPVALD